MSELNGPDRMRTEATHWYPETRLVRLDRCRRFLFGEGIITGTVNDAVRKSLLDAHELVIAAAQDTLGGFVEEDEPEPEDG